MGIQPTPEQTEKKRKRKKNDKSEAKKSEKENVEASKPKTVWKSSTNVEKKSSGEKKRGRRMVMKSKQYLDEDGFMVTKKEYESESFSEESESEMTEEQVKTLSPEKKKKVETKKAV